MLSIVLVTLITVATLLVGAAGVRFARTTSNFFVAGRSVHPAWNAFAICGEYMSAGSYLGLAGLVLVFGVDILWFPVGWTAGYLLLLLFVAAPLRRFGSYTIPEFAEGRMESPALRRLSAVFVLVISWLYLLPQMKGAGVVLRRLLGTPFWVGVVLLGIVVAINLTAGGMRSITFVQGFQFFVIVFGVLAPAAIMWTVWIDRGDPLVTSGPVRTSDAVTIEYPNAVTLDIPEGVTVVVDPESDAERVLSLEAGDELQVDAGTTIRWPAGAALGTSVAGLDGETWVEPLGDKPLAGGHPLWFTYSALAATMLGTMGLPHVLVRFYTNPDGRTARRTTVWVLALLGPYYAILPFYGALGRVFAPEVVSSGETDAVSVVLGERLLDGVLGEVTVAIIASGAVAAMLSTASGLLVAVAGAISHDLARGGVRQFRQATWFGATVAVLLGLSSEPFDISILVNWAFAVAASSFCPLLVLGIWWRGLTVRGAVSGMIVGGGAATSSILATMVGVVDAGWPLAVLSAPALWSVPLAFTTAIVVSRRDATPVPDVVHKMALLHLPDRSAVVAER